jgi:ribosomal protein S12 methylthiotransferase accessory factor
VPDGFHPSSTIDVPRVPAVTSTDVALLAAELHWAIFDPVAQDAQRARFPRLVERAVDDIPITRVHSARRLDWADLSVSTAVTPLAADLTTHSGRGATEEAARLSAVMEAVERTAAEGARPAAPNELTGSFQDLRARYGPVVRDPRDYSLPYDSTYSPAETYTWCVGYDLCQDAPAALPADLVYSPPSQGICSGVETNGLGAGDTYLRATLHAVMEVVERDALSIDLATAYFCDHRSYRTHALDRTTLPAEVATLVSTVESEGGVRLSVRQLRSASGLPVYSVDLQDPRIAGFDAPGPVFAGVGCAPSSVRAARSAILEAVQSHAGLATPDDAESVAAAYTTQEYLHNRAGILHGVGTTPFLTVGEEHDEPTADALRFVLDLIAPTTPSCLVFDLGHHAGGLPAVRAVLEGYTYPFPDSSRALTPRLRDSVLREAVL